MGMVEFLTDIWDEDVFEVKTKNRGTDHIMGPYVTLLGCLTTETMTNLMNTKIISSGFSRRCMFVYSADMGNPVPRPVVTPSQKAAWERCVKRAKELQTVHGQFEWGDGAAEFYDNWYCKNHDRKKTTDSQIEEGFLQSKSRLCPQGRDAHNAFGFRRPGLDARSTRACACVH